MSKRYDLAASASGGFSMHESEYGNWVTWGAHYKLEAELDRAANEIHRLGMKCSVQEDELQALRSALERITRTYGSAGAVNIAREALLERGE